MSSSPFRGKKTRGKKKEKRKERKKKGQGRRKKRRRRRRTKREEEETKKGEGTKGGAHGAGALTLQAGAHALAPFVALASGIFVCSS